MEKSTDYENFTPTKLKALLEQSNQKLEFFKSAIESISCGFLLIDLETKVTFINKFTKNLFNRNIEGYQFEEIFPHGPMHDKLVAILKGESGELVKGELCPFVNDKDEAMYFLITLFPHMLDKKLAGWLLIIQNYTERFHELNLQHRSEQLSSSMQIASSIAHEIKNPLGAISIHLQILSKKLKRMDCKHASVDELEEGKDEMIGFINVIEEEIENLNNVVSEFLNNFKNQEAEQKLYDVNEIINSLITFIKPDFEQRNIVYHLDLYKEQLLIACSSSSITHVMLNVIKNAMDVMSDGGEITIKSYHKDSRIIVSISDTGPGIPEDKIESIFSPYMTTKENGTGIGLALSDKIMQSHKGSIFVDPTYHDGARFILDFPAIADERHLLEAPSDIVGMDTSHISFSCGSGV